MSFIVAIDGPTSSGKSTISNLIAKDMGFVYIQTGAMYRCVALELLEQGVSLKDIEHIEEILKEIDIHFMRGKDGQNVIMNGKDVTEQIRTKEVTDYCSDVASLSVVRHKLLQKQRKIASGSNIIVEGRDTGTTVFPNADVKFFLTAQATVRARRKQQELARLGEDLSFIDVLKSVYKWDEDSIKRKEGALKRAKDSIFIDNSEMEVEELKEKMLEIVKQKYKEREEWYI